MDSSRNSSGERERTLVFISNQAYSIVNFRGQLLRDLSGRGIKVYALAPDYDEQTRQKIEQLGASPLSYRLRRTGLNPLRDLFSLIQLILLLRRIRPDFVFCNFVKPVIYGSIAAKLARVPRCYSMLSGLGFIYTHSASKFSKRKYILIPVMDILYKVSLAFNEKVFFHNPDDLREFTKRGLLEQNKAVRTYGSGVDLKHFCIHEKSPPEQITCVMIARLLIEKGVREYFQAAKDIKSRHPHVRFLLLGGLDANPGGISEQEIEGWHREGIVEWKGRVADVKEWLEKSQIFVLPSWREGTPRSTLEAMACGLPIITTDVPGCRETVFFEKRENKGSPANGIRIGLNGALTPVRDPATLAKAIEQFIESPKLAEKMGEQSRKFAEHYFDVHQVNEMMFKEMNL